ncbi:hypothetical protein [Halobacillus aidingensis]|uniref:Uncharacterized protein n=1 Tax=Halobacillus aidingensis TaxID=240303 RepID=A0A1H0S950_HALAD|nr:hypothetical protein [Halobacillus aidingensis]SDP38280.1 hypothetical protein SAMN05421677_11773 [Halobacillus aidingensis]
MSRGLLFDNLKEKHRLGESLPLFRELSREQREEIYNTQNIDEIAEVFNQNVKRVKDVWREGMKANITLESKKNLVNGIVNQAWMLLYIPDDYKEYYGWQPSEEDLRKVFDDTKK